MLQKTEIPVRHFTVYRMKGVPERALKDVERLRRFDLDPHLQIRGAVYVRLPKESEPPWVEFLENGIRGKLPSLSNATTAAVLFIREKRSRKWFAYCFGRGSTLLDLEQVELEFGLRVALNAVDPDKLRAVDSRAVGQVTLETLRQSSSAAPLQEFGIDVMGDLLRAVTGEPRDPGFALRVTGRDALALDTRVEFFELARQVEDFNRLFVSKAYKPYFDWVDDIRLVRDAALIGRLDAALLERLRRGDTAGMHLAYPGIVDYEKLDGYSFSTDRARTVRVEPIVKDYLETLRRGPQNLSLSMLHDHVIGLHLAGDVTPAETWSVYRGLIAETARRGRTYILSAGQWYRIAKRLNDAVNRFLKSVKKNSVKLPKARAGEHEGDYNERVAKKKHYALCDRLAVVRPRGATTGIEFCDLLTSSRKLVHVKWGAKSASLSHLFAQAYASAEAFLYDDLYRSRVRSKLGPEFQPLIPKEAPSPRSFEVAFAVIGGPKARWPYSLPFLSKLTFRNVAQRLRRFGYRVSLNRVEAG